MKILLSFIASATVQDGSIWIECSEHFNKYFKAFLQHNVKHTGQPVKFACWSERSFVKCLERRPKSCMCCRTPCSRLYHSLSKSAWRTALQPATQGSEWTALLFTNINVSITQPVGQKTRMKCRTNICEVKGSRSEWTTI